MKKIFFFAFTAINIYLPVIITNKAGNNQLKIKPSSVSVNNVTDTGIARIVQMAKIFKATLNNEQSALLQLAYSKTDAVKWSNFPQAFTRTKRVGVSFSSLNSAQLVAAKNLIAVVLGKGTMDEGSDEFDGIRAAGDYFGKETGNTETFGAGNYFIAFLGKPGTTGLWELQFGGHHFAFANTYKDGKVMGATPSFRGVEPKKPVTANGRTYQPIEQEREAFSKMIEGLTIDEKSIAKLTVRFSDILLGPGRDGDFPNSKQGQRIGDLTNAQQQLVLNAIKLYVNDLDAVTPNHS